MACLLEWLPRHVVQGLTVSLSACPPVGVFINRTAGLLKLIGYLTRQDHNLAPEQRRYMIIKRSDAIMDWHAGTKQVPATCGFWLLPS